MAVQCMGARTNPLPRLTARVQERVHTFIGTLTFCFLPACTSSTHAACCAVLQLCTKPQVAAPLCVAFSHFCNATCLLAGGPRHWHTPHANPTCRLNSSVKLLTICILYLEFPPLGKVDNSSQCQQRAHTACNLPACLCCLATPRKASEC